MISEGHPLRQLVNELTHHRFNDDIHLRDPAVEEYVTNLLVEFSATEELFKIRNSDGRPLHDVGEMLIETDPIYGPAPSFDRERQVRKHIGDYVLFLAGMFPESINRERLRRHRVENLVDLIRAGKESYHVVSKFDQFEYEHVAPLFGKLEREFENCVCGLNMVKNDLVMMRCPITPRSTSTQIFIA